MRIVLAGASGLVGGLLVPRLGGHDVTLLVRREIASDGAQLTGPITDWPALIEGRTFDAAISTLGTTIKLAGSQAAFAAIDRDAVIAVATAARAAGARHFALVSSVGASATASNFYLRTKGEAEAGVRAVGFERVDIFRPGLLRGDRPGAPRRAEGLAMLASPLTDLLTPAVLDQYRSIAAAAVARAIVAALDKTEAGVFVHHNREMLRSAASVA